MTPRGSTVGVDNWPKRWEEKERILETVDWSIFRRNPQLMEGIQTGARQFDLWHERAKAAGIEPRHFEDSLFGLPDGRTVDGVFATADSLRMACYAAVLFERWSPPSHFNVLDIGGGYGAFALALLRWAIADRYFGLDAKPCLEMQSVFTGGSLGPQMEEWRAPARFDLVVNTNSFGEMDIDEVKRHFGIIQRWLVPGGAFYTQNRLERVTDFRQYPYGPGWRHVLVRHPFGDKAWVECLSIRDRGANEPHPLELLR